METLGSNCSPRRHAGAQVRELYCQLVLRGLQKRPELYRLTDCGAVTMRLFRNFGHSLGWVRTGFVLGKTNPAAAPRLMLPARRIWGFPGNDWNGYTLFLGEFGNSLRPSALHHPERDTLG